MTQIPLFHKYSGAASPYTIRGVTFMIVYFLMILAKVHLNIRFKIALWKPIFNWIHPDHDNDICSVSMANRYGFRSTSVDV